MIVNVQSVQMDGTPWDIPWRSEVYAIDGNRFLVYNPGVGLNREGFEWVDFTETYVEKVGAEESFRRVGLDDRFAH